MFQKDINYFELPPGTAFDELETVLPAGSVLIYEEMTPFQLIRLFKQGSDYWMSLNGSIQFHTQEKDLSHEYMCDLPLRYLKKKTSKIPSVLIVGGGDGLPTKHFLKYGLPVTQVELDEQLINFTKKHPIMRKISNNSFNSKNINLIAGDGLEYVIRCRKKYDLILDDCDIDTNQPAPKGYKSFISKYKDYQKNLISTLTENGIAIVAESVDQEDEHNNRFNRFLDSINLMLNRGKPKRCWMPEIRIHLDFWKKHAPFMKSIAVDLPYIAPEHYIYMSKKPLK